MTQPRHPPPALPSPDLADHDPLDVAAAQWHVRRQDGLSAEEEAQFQAWLAQDPAHPSAFNALAGVWDRLEALPPADIARLKAAAITPAPAPRARAASTGRSPWRLGLFVRQAMRQIAGQMAKQMAAVAVALTVLAGGWWGWDHWQRQPLFSQTYATVRGQQLEVRLPDGSELKLDTATRAEVTLYRQRREIKLPQGQAMFSVKADTSQPFHVRAGALRITVVGTRFSVRNTASGLGAGTVSVAVEEGRVRVASAQASAVELTAGQSVQTEADGRLRRLDAQVPASALSWREGRVNFEHTPLAQALAEFERYGNTRLVITDPAVGAMRINGSFELRQLGTFVQALPQVLPVRLKARNGVTEIVAAP